VSFFLLAAYSSPLSDNSFPRAAQIGKTRGLGCWGTHMGLIENRRWYPLFKRLMHRGLQHPVRRAGLRMEERRRPLVRRR
jgi:hypothetical protein